MGIGEKPYTYMMDTLRKIIRKVEEISTDWWWFEQGSMPVIQVRRLVTNGEIKLDWTPKVPVVHGLKIIYNNFDKIGEIPQEKRLGIAIKSAQDLYAVLLAVTYIMEAHDLAERLNKFKEKLSRMRPDAVEVFVEEMRRFISRLRETLLSNIMSWPNVKNEFVKIVESMIKKTERILGEGIPREVEEVKKKELVGA